MPKIMPISDLRNYGTILEKVEPSSPVYLARNGHGIYSVHSIEDDEEFEKNKAMLKLMTELVKGFNSGEEDGWLSDEDVDRHFSAKKVNHLFTPAPLPVPPPAGQFWHPSAPAVHPSPSVSG